ncbi:MAG: hypothetical protein ABIM45_06550 [candidate division WOR-3 bacterium]
MFLGEKLKEVLSKRPSFYDSKKEVLLLCACGDVILRWLEARYRINLGSAAGRTKRPALAFQDRPENSEFKIVFLTTKGGKESVNLILDCDLENARCPDRKRCVDPRIKSYLMGEYCISMYFGDIPKYFIKAGVCYNLEQLQRFCSGRS